MKDWEKRYGEVSLKKGVVLTLSQDKHYLTKTQPLAALIGETLAPGVYLLSEDAAEEAAAALRNAGVDIIAHRVCSPNKTVKKSLSLLRKIIFSLLQRAPRK